MEVAGRLKPDVSLDAARADLRSRWPPGSVGNDLTSGEFQVLAAVGTAGEYVQIDGTGPTALAERKALDHLISVRLVVLWPGGQPLSPDGAGSANVRLSEMGQRVLSADIAWREQAGPEQ